MKEPREEILKEDEWVCTKSSGVPVHKRDSALKLESWLPGLSTTPSLPPQVTHLSMKRQILPWSEQSLGENEYSGSSLHKRAAKNLHMRSARIWTPSFFGVHHMGSSTFWREATGTHSDQLPCAQQSLIH